MCLRLCHHHEWGWKNLCLKLIHNFHGFEMMVEESKEVFSNLATLSETLELDLQEDSFTELLAVQHEKLTNEVLELEAQIKDRERQEEDVIEERQRFILKPINFSGCCLFRTFLADSFDTILIFCLIIVCMCAHVCVQA